MKERINWIDWAKALAVCSVVFCHLPQSQEWFYYRYLQALTMVVFFFISGYLKKNRGSDKENWKKYWYGLIVPYILYNVVVYPYWILKYYLVHGGMPDMFQAMRPLIGALLMEHESSFAGPLNGPLWYLPAILFMHILIDLCRKTKYQHRIMTGLCILSVILYGANKYWEFAPQLTPIGIMRNLPYYYMGEVHLFQPVVEGLQRLTGYSHLLQSPEFLKGFLLIVLADVDVDEVDDIVGVVWLEANGLRVVEFSQRHEFHVAFNVGTSGIGNRAIGMLLNQNVHFVKCLWEVLLFL